MLLIEGDGLSLDGGNDLAILRKMSASVRVMGILDKVRRDLPTVFKIHLGLSAPVSRDGRRGQNARAMPKIGKGNEQATILAKKYLESLYPYVPNLDHANHAIASNRIDVLGLKRLHKDNHKTRGGNAKGLTGSERRGRPRKVGQPLR